MNQTNVEHLFILAAQLRAKYGKDFEKIVTGAMGMITYFDHLNAGLQQLMDGARKFALKHITRGGLCALPRVPRMSREYPRHGIG